MQIQEIVSELANLAEAHCGVIIGHNAAMHRAEPKPMDVYTLSSVLVGSMLDQDDALTNAMVFDSLQDAQAAANDEHRSVTLNVSTPRLTWVELPASSPRGATVRTWVAQGDSSVFMIRQMVK